MGRGRAFFSGGWLSRLRERRGRKCVSVLLAQADDYNGYTREKALHAMKRLAEVRPALIPELLPALLWRTTDWVEPVRKAALEGLRACLPRVDVAGLLRYVDILHRVRRAERAVPEAWPLVIGRLAELVRTDDGRAWLAPTSNPAERHFLWDVLLEQPDRIEPNFWEKAWVDPAPRIRGLAARHAPVTSWDAARWRHFLAGEPMTPLRRDALRRLVELRPQPVDVGDCYRTAAGDRSREVRETARYALKTFESVEPRAWYRQALNEHAPEVPPGLAAGLAETGDVDDVPRFHAWLRHADDQVRAAGLTGLARQAPDAAEKAALALLDDPRRLPRKTAVWVLRSRPQRAEDVRAVLCAGTPNGRKAAFRVLTFFPGMARILDILDGLAQPPLRRLAWASLGAWASKYGWFSANSRHTWRTASPELRTEAERRVQALVNGGLPRPDSSRLTDVVFHAAAAPVPPEAWAVWNSLPAVLREWGK